MSWRTIRQALKNSDMRKRLLYVLFAMLIFRFLSFIPIPLDEPTQLRQLLDSLFNSQQLLGFLDNLSGGALSNFSIVLMGLGPYINASIVLQLLTHSVPKLMALNKEGQSGRQKINQYTRWLSLPFAILQSFGLLVLIRQQASGVSGLESFASGTSIGQWVLMIAALVGGSMLLMWLGELMSEQGVGNGISLLIFAGIVSQLPSTGSLLISTVFGSDATFSIFNWFTLPISGEGALFALGLIIMVIFMTYFVVKLNEANRAITVSYAKRVRGNRAYGGVETILPIKLIIAGVIPIIFATAFLSVPTLVGQIMAGSGSESLQSIGQNLTVWFNPQGFSTQGQTGILSTDFRTYIYPISYFALVVMFTYFYTSLTFNSKEISENLQQQGGFIAGIRPGNQTEKYLGKVVTRLTLFGALALGGLAIFPYVLDAIVIAIYKTPLSSQLTIGGTSILITVSVAIETLRQIESRALMVTYDAPEN